MNYPWFRMYQDIIDDERLRLLKFEDRWHFVALLCCNCKRIIEQSNKELMRRMVAVKLGLDIESLNEVVKRLAEVGLVDENTLKPLHFYEDRTISNNSLRPSSEVWRDIRRTIFERDDFTCQYCGERGVKLECDHVIPVSRGGNSEHSNLVTAFFSCNRSKHNKLVKEWLQ